MPDMQKFKLKLNSSYKKCWRKEREKVGVLIRKKTINSSIEINQQFCARMNSILCQSSIRCADIPREVCKRLQINSCLLCDLFTTDVKVKKQHKVCQRRCGCRREVNKSYEICQSKSEFCGQVEEET